MKIDPKAYLLYNKAQRAAFEAKMGNNLVHLIKSIDKYISNMPEGIWCNYLRGVPEKNIPIIIGCLCIWMEDNPVTVSNQTISLNDSATHIKKLVWINPNQSEKDETTPTI